MMALLILFEVLDIEWNPRHSFCYSEYTIVTLEEDIQWDTNLLYWYLAAVAKMFSINKSKLN